MSEHPDEKDTWCWWCSHDGNICHARGCGCLSHPLAEEPTPPEEGES